MQEIKVSLFASAVRPKLWPALFKSLDNTNVEYEVVFAGNCQYIDIPYFHNEIDFDYTRGYLIFPIEPKDEFTINKDKYNLKYISTGNIKPAQCYEIARRHCIGEVVVWIADDCEFPNDIIGKAYKYWKSQNNEKLILSLQTKESGYGQKDGKLFPMKEHTFYSLMPETGLMAPIAMMSRNFLNDIGGLDRKYICGQYENDIVMRAYANGATVEIFGDENCYVDIDHLTKSIAIGESTDEESFRQRPFASGYDIDRKVLEDSWTIFNQTEAFKRLEKGERPFSLRTVSSVQLNKFEPYEDKDLLTKSQSNKGKWE